MSESVEIRQLAATESAYAATQVYFGYAVRVSGRVDLDSLSEAYRALTDNYPILAARIESGASGYVLVTPSGSAPEISVVDGDPETQFIGAELRQSVALSGLSVVRDGTDANITFWAHHSAADACHALTLLAELWSYYSDIAVGEKVEKLVNDYPLPVEELLTARGIEKLPASPTANGPFGSRVPADLPRDGRFWRLRSSRIRFSEQQTAALIAVCRREGLTLSSLLAGAIMLAEAEIREMALTDLQFGYPVDLHTRVSPPVGKTEGTNVLSFAVYQPTDPGAELFDLARGVTAELNAGLAGGFIQRIPLMQAATSGGLATGPGMILASNWGSIPSLRTPPGLRITDFRSAQTNRTPGKPMEFPGGGGIIISTYDNRLSIELHHAESLTAQQSARAREIEAVVLAAIGRPAPATTFPRDLAAPPLLPGPATGPRTAER